MHDPSPPRPTMPAGVALAVMVVALLLGLFLNAEDILRTAERQPAGPARSAAVFLARPVAAASDLLRLDRPRHAIDLALDRAEATDTTPATTTTTTSVPVPATTATTGVEAARVYTTADPLRVYVGGDSMVGQFGPMLENLAEGTAYATVEVRYEFESGLTRPDFIDWNVVLAEAASTHNPEVVVLFFGGNDAQDIRIDGVWEPFGTDEWVAEYRRRVQQVMETVTSEGRELWWVGMPVVRSASFREKLAVLNEIFDSEAAAHEGVAYIDSWTPFTGPDGNFSEFLPDATGDVVDMRLNDGVHFTTAGGQKLAAIVWGDIAAQFGLPES